MPAENNQFKFDHSYPGLCSLCHTEIAEFDGSKGKAPVITKLKSNARRARVVLSDDSIMTVMICKECEGKVDDNLRELMESEINGWSYQVNTLLRDKWSYEKKVEYLDRYKALTITSRVGQEKTPEIKSVRKSKLKVAVRR